MIERKPLKTNIKIEIAGANKIIEDADIELEIKKTNEKEPNYCTVTIYNMADSTYNEINDKIIDNMIPSEKEDMLNRLLKYIQLLYKYDYMGCELFGFGCNDGNYLNVAGINPLQTELVVLEIKGVD